jgi:hypothetical protein
MMRMRLNILALVIFNVLPPAVYGQSPAGYVNPRVAVRPDPPPHFTIAPRGSLLPRLVLPQNGLPLPQHGLRPWVRRAERGASLRNTVYFGWPMMVYYAPEPVAAVPAQPEPLLKPVEPPVLGRLVLDVAPATAQIFVDGYYVGVPEDFSAGRGGGLLAAGPHHLDISADGHEPVAVELMIAAAHAVTYRATLKGFPPPAAVPSTTFYLIPGCYMGNIPPKDARLPPTCDQTRAVIWRP